MVALSMLAVMVCVQNRTIGSVLMGKRLKKATMKGVDTMECPCRGCTDRTITCHGVCQRYQDWKKNREDVNNWLIKQRPITSETAAKKFREKVIKRARGYEKGGGGK